MKKRVNRFVAVIATIIVMATAGSMATAESMTTGMATDTTPSKEVLDILMNELKDSSEDRPENLQFDFNGDGVVNIADAVVLATDDQEIDPKKIVEKTDWVHPAFFQDPQNGVVYAFYKRYYVPYELDFQNVPVDQLGMGSGVICVKAEKEFPSDYNYGYVQELDDLDYVKTGEFNFEGEKYEYHVENPAKYDFSVRQHLLNIIVNIEEMTAEDVAKYDFDMNGEIDIRDVVYFNKVFWNVPWKWVTSYQGDGDMSFQVQLREEEFWNDFRQNESADSVTIEYFI